MKPNPEWGELIKTHCRHNDGLRKWEKVKKIQLPPKVNPNVIASCVFHYLLIEPDPEEQHIKKNRRKIERGIKFIESIKPDLLDEYELYRTRAIINSFRKPGRPRGLHETLLCATLAEYFKQMVGRPDWKVIGQILESATTHPQAFDSIRKRVEKLPPKQHKKVKEEVKFLRKHDPLESWGKIIKEPDIGTKPLRN